VARRGAVQRRPSRAPIAAVRTRFSLLDADGLEECLVGFVRVLLLEALEARLDTAERGEQPRRRHVVVGLEPPLTEDAGEFPAECAV
jgi:hypothetical protein